jgi:dsRNA-specific ribonuclease
MYQTISDGILQWIKGDVEGIKKSMADYEKKLQEYAREEAAQKPKIQVAGANVLSQLDSMSGGKGKLIV